MVSCLDYCCRSKTSPVIDLQFLTMSKSALFRAFELCNMTNDKWTPELVYF